MSEISEKVIVICKPYLGPATESFLNRQCTGHLSVGVSGLEKVHLPELAKWVEVSAKLIMDPAKAKEVAAKIARL
jgi:hypothetical protein